MVWAKALGSSDLPYPELKLEVSVESFSNKDSNLAKKHPDIVEKLNDTIFNVSKSITNSHYY